MKPQPTNELKARFFAQYWGQEVFRQSYYLADECNDEVQSFCLKSKKGFLELKPLSSITDEDAIEMGKINNWRRGVDFSISAYNYKRIAISFEKGELGFNYETADYLRSKGYALPFMGYSVEELIELGWIKLKES